MMSAAFATYHKCVDDGMPHEEAIKQVESDHDAKHANLVQGSFDGGAKGGATTGKMISEAFKTYNGYLRRHVSQGGDRLGWILPWLEACQPCQRLIHSLAGPRRTR